MPGKINVYNLGAKGVNVVKSPVHLDDGEFVSAQNVQIDPVKSLGGVRKRDGMTRLNSVAMTGSGKGIINLPLPDRSTYVRRFFVPYDYATGAVGSNTFWTSTDGTTWTAGNRGAVPLQAFDISSFGFLSSTTRICVHRNRMYYPGHDGYIHAFDGDTDTDYTLVAIPRNPRDASGPVGVMQIIPYSSTQLVISTYDSSSRGRIFLMNVTNGQLVQLGQETDPAAVPAVLHVYGGKIWIGQHNVSGGNKPKLYYVRPGDATLSEDTAFTAAIASSKGYIHGMCTFLGELYVGVGADVVTGGGYLAKRDKDATWTVGIAPTDGTGAANYVKPLIVSRDGLTMYRHWNSISGGASPIYRIQSTTDGATFTTAYNAGDLVNSAAAIPWMDTNGDIYFVLFSPSSANGNIIKLSGGSFTVVKANAQLSNGIVALSMPS